MQEDFDQKLKEKQMELWKSDMAQRQLVEQMAAMSKEMQRLEKVKDIGESIARLPSACLQDIKTHDEVQNAKAKALHSALDQVRGKDYSNLVKDIDDIQNKSKRAYVRLYEKVGEEIGMNFLNKLDYMSSK